MLWRSCFPSWSPLPRRCSTSSCWAPSVPPPRQSWVVCRAIHARPPCRRGARASAETVEALDRIEGELWRREWCGMGELSARDVYVALIKAAREHGEQIPSGVRALALAAAVSKRTAGKAVARLKAAGMIHSDNAGRSGTQAGALVLLTSNATRASVAHLPTGGGAGSSGLHLRGLLTAPRLRRASSRPATCAAVRSSGSPPRWGRALWRLGWSTSTWPIPSREDPAPSPASAPDFWAYSPECVEGKFSEVRCATGRASLLLGSGPWLRHVHRFELLEDA